LRAGDISPVLVKLAQAHYGERVKIAPMDAQALRFEDRSLDVVILFEAVYYLPSAEAFVKECLRVLRPGGTVLLVTANKDLYDFNPSPFSHRYYGVVELGDLFGSAGFACEFFGNTAVDAVSWRQRILRPVKATVVKLDLMPKTMAGKKALKRLVFGRLAVMPAEISAATATYRAPARVEPGVPNRQFKVIHLAATLRG
jgi:SAM-dependent methyltransferase